MSKILKKDINKYWNKYKKIYSFEQFSAIYREQELLKLLSFSRKNVLEIGCGYRPFFLSTKKFYSYTAIEPGKAPFDSVVKMRKRKKNIKVFNSTFEKWSSLNPNIKVDLIILPGVLHEVDDALQFLKLCVKHIKNKGKIYINVPNANSLHRKIAVAMNIIKKNTDRSDRNRKLQQNYIFSIKDLRKLVKQSSKNLRILKIKTFFLKPFTHDQMLKCVSNKILNKDVIAGLYNVSRELDDIGSEIACVLEFINE